MNQDQTTLEFPRIIAMLQALSVSQAAREELAHLEPSPDEGVCIGRMEATSAALRVLDSAG